MRRFLARQFARPSGMIGRWFIAPWLDRISTAMNRLVLERLEVGENDSVLEIGFGGGGLLADLVAATRGEVIGIDISADMVARGRRRFRGVNRLALHRASAEQLPLAAASIDKACSVNSLYFWPDPAAGFRELGRVVRPGGRLVVAFEPPEELRKWPGHRHGFRLVEAAQVEAWMAAAGFGRVGVTEGRGRRPDRFLCLTAERR